MTDAVVDRVDLALPGSPDRPTAASGEAPAIMAGFTDAMSRFERAQLIAALDVTGWNVVRAAQQLGIPRTTLRHRMTKYRLARGGVTLPATAGRPGANGVAAKLPSPPPAVLREERTVALLQASFEHRPGCHGIHRKDRCLAATSEVASSASWRPSGFRRSRTRCRRARRPRRAECLCAGRPGARVMAERSPRRRDRSPCGRCPDGESRRRIEPVPDRPASSRPVPLGARGSARWRGRDLDPRQPNDRAIPRAPLHAGSPRIRERPGGARPSRPRTEWPRARGAAPQPDRTTGRAKTLRALRTGRERAGPGRRAYREPGVGKSRLV
jgi:hypothetical protein